MRERYYYDFGMCRGWAQLDTKADASYYGTWACPKEKKLIAFIEGDETITSCDTIEEWVKEVKDWFNWANDIGYEPLLDAGLNDEYVKLWTDLGLTNNTLNKIKNHGS